MKVAVLVSGGVDSSVALKLLKEEGHTVTAYYVKIWLEDELSFLGECPWEEDLHYVRSLCDKENVDLKILSLQKEYHEEVVRYTIAEIRAGRTPNPDILCNQRIKFGVAMQHIGSQFDKIATGHYARLMIDQNGIILSKAPDPIKDQTYFLSYVRQEQLRKLLFPIGSLTKAEVRKLAVYYNLPAARRKDSQGICFLGKIKFSEFIHQYLGDQQGDFIEYETGRSIGSHNGYYYYTIGQRKGIGLAGGPWYVVRKDAETNRVYISRNYYTEDKKRDKFTVKDCNWISGNPPSNGTIIVKLRHGQAEHVAHITVISPSTAKVCLAEQDQGIAPGQFAAFYHDSVCLGAGVICLNE